MSDFNEELVTEINKARTNPKKYAKIISKYLDYFKGNILYLPGCNAGIQLEEGPEAYKEAIEYLSKQSRIRALKPSKGLCRIAKDFLEAVQKPNSNDLEHIDMEEIINKYGTFNGSFSRAIDFGGETPEQVVINLIVSDGDKTRDQRESLLNSQIKRIGVANGEHNIYRHCSIIVTCPEFENTFDHDEDDNGLLKEDEKFEKKNKIHEKEETEGSTNPKKIVLKNIKNKADNPNNKDGNKKSNDPLPPGVASINKNEKIIMERGNRIKVTRIEKLMDDGAKEIETIKEIIE